MASSTLQQAYRYCEWITYQHYENFPVASWILPKAVRPHIAAVYAFARSADDFADEQKYQGRSLELLEQWRKALWACADGIHGGVRPEQAIHPSTKAQDERRVEGHPIFLALGNTIRQCRLPVQLLDDLLTAFRMDVTKRRYGDWGELLTYCRYSANPVGRLVLSVFGIHDPQLHRYSDRICTALQLANHWQDLRIDLARNLLYIPQTLLREYRVTEEELKNYGGQTPRGLTPAFRALMEELVHRARALFDEGAPMIDRVSGPLRLELRLTLLGGQAILDRIESVRYDVFRHRPTLSGWGKARLLLYAVNDIGWLSGTRPSPRGGGTDRNLRAAARYCRWLTRQARSHFALSFRWLGPAEREGMEAVYAFCRAVDDVVDRDGFTEAQAREELNRWRRELEAMGRGCPTHPITVAMGPACRRFGIPRAYLEKLIVGVEMDLGRRRYRTFEELEGYCEHVASVVGLISIRVFGCRHPATDRYATDLGIAFQLTNILRDLKSDALAGRAYLPSGDLERFGVAEADLLQGNRSEGYRRLMSFQCERARSYFRRAEEALAEGGEHRRVLSARIMGAVYARLLRRIEERNFDVFSERVRVHPLEQLWLALKAIANLRTSHHASRITHHEP